MISYQTITPVRMAWVHEKRIAGWSFKKICEGFKSRYTRSMSVKTLTRHYNYAMKHGFSAWSENPEGM